MRFTVRLMEATDADQLAKARLRMLADHPENFGTSFEDEARLSAADFAARISRQATPPASVMFGAFDGDGQLQGMVGLSFNVRSKEKHRASIVSMYTTPEVRGEGVGRLLLMSALAYAREGGRVDMLTLAVTEGNTGAEALYASVGFVRYGVEPRSIRTGGRDYAKVMMACDLRGQGG